MLLAYIETMFLYMDMFSLDNFERMDILTQIEDEVLECEIR